VHDMAKANRARFALFPLPLLCSFLIINERAR